MKIAISDNNGGKFSSDIQLHFEKLGHEVKFEPGASEHLAQWADVYFIDCWDNNIHYLFDIYHENTGGNRPKDFDINKKPKFIVRPLDWEVWIGLAKDQQIIDWVDEAICIAPHIEKKLKADNDWGNKLHLIPAGVNTEKFHMKTTKTNQFQLGMVLGDMWWPKNHMGGLDIFTSLLREDPRWRLHIRGQHEGGGGGEYWKQMYEHYLDSRGIRPFVTLYEHVPDMNAWYEQIDVLLHPGMKEAFCYAVGEAMSKGIPAVVNQFYGSEDIWPKDILYQTHEEAIEKLIAIPGSSPDKWYRNEIVKNHNIETMLKEIDKLL